MENVSPELPRVVFLGVSEPGQRLGCSVPIPVPPWFSKKLSYSPRSRCVCPLPRYTRHETSRSVTSPFHVLLLTKGVCHSQSSSHKQCRRVPFGGWWPSASQVSPPPAPWPPSREQWALGREGSRHGQQQPWRLTSAPVVPEPHGHYGSLHCVTSTVSAELAKALQPASSREGDKL